MIISAIRILFGPYAPDPTYKNIYDYAVDPSISPNALPAYFFDHLVGLDKYDVPFPEGATICPIGETETGFTVEIPTDGDFPVRPLYLILTTETGYRYAFIDSYTRTASSKIRCVARFDQWTEHHAELSQAEFTFTRRHQARYTEVNDTTVKKVYNGLSDPIPEGMVQGFKETVPVEMFGAKTVTDEGVDYLIIPVWFYQRLSTYTLYYYSDGNWVSRPLVGVDPFKSAVPTIATFLGVNRVNPVTKEVKFLPCRRTFVPTADQPTRGTQPTLDDLVYTIVRSHPYITQSYISTIPPFDCTIGIRSDHVSSFVTVNDDWFTANGEYIGDGTQYRIGSDQAANALIPQTGTFIGVLYSGDNLVYPGDKKSITLRDVTLLKTSVVASYEPKIEESPYEGTTLHIFGAEIDISPTRAIGNVALVYFVGEHNDLYLTSDGTEIYRAQGICSQFGMDTATDSLSSWLTSNYNTFQNARLWKGIGAGTSIFTSLITAIATGNFLPLVGVSIGAGSTIGQSYTGETAMRKDLQNSPNAATLSSDNAVDNMPLLDLPTIEKRTIPDDVKSRIMAFWHIYGYPDNKIGTIRDGINREKFHYMQGTLVRPPAGLYPGEYSSIESAIRSGVWLWSSIVSVIMPGGTVSISTDRLTPLLNLENSEI